MFYNCTSLVGGNGTKYDSDHTGGAYARIDGGTSAPGYFTFTTLEVTPPVVRLTLNNPVAELSADKESVVYYVVADTDATMLDPVVNNVFWNNTPSGGRQPVSSYAQVNNVLEAMMLDTGNGSVFDVYTTAEYKEKVEAYIRQSLSNGVSLIGIGKGMQVSSTSSLTIDSSTLPMQQGHKYALISMTEGFANGLKVFRAAYPITPPDTTPPLVTNIQNTLAMDSGDSRTCSGNVALTCDSNLYYLNGSVMKAIDLGPHYSTLRSDTFTPLVDYGSSSPAGEIAVSTGQVAYVNRPTSVINLTLKNASSGATITFPTKLCDEYGNMHTLPLTVSLRIVQGTTQVDVDNDGNPVYGFISSPLIELTPAWDGTSSETR